MKPSLIIRMGAAKDEVVINGHTFDRSQLSKSERREFNRQVLEVVAPKGKRRAR
jgi:hypothetical protein